MPRPKVKPHERKRVAQACISCKASKKKCDGELPCRHCRWRNEADTCAYDHGRQRSERLAIVHRPEAPAKDDTATTSPSNTTGSSATAARLLWTSKGQQVYVGSSASLAFLQALRTIFARCMGPSEFTTDPRQDSMLEERRRTFDKQSYACEHAVEDALELMDYCQAATCGILDVFDKNEMADCFMADYFNGGEALRTAFLHAVLAIGAQARASGPVDDSCEGYHFAEAQTIVLDTMLEDPSLDMVRTFILLAFYLLGACRRNGAFMYIGIAARAAYALGIHELQSWHPSDVERESKYAVWKSIRILDLIVCTTLGRPPSTKQHTSSGQSLQQAGHHRIALNATFDVWNVIDKVVNFLYQSGSPTSAPVGVLLNELEAWSSRLDPALKSQPAGPTSANQHVIVGNMHVACSYYFGVMLATRGLLITDLTSKLSGNSPEEVIAMRRPAAVNNEKDSSAYAQTCIDSAVLTLQTCYEVYTAKIMLDSMCLIKVWVFTASMVLGFALFFKDEPDMELEAAFQKGQTVLRHLAAKSVQAKRYLDILTDLRAAINAHLAQIVLPDNNRRSFVSKIFSMGHARSPASFIDLPRLDPSLTDSTPNSQNQRHTQQQPPETPDDLLDTFGVAMNDIDSVALNLWDNFVGVPGLYFNH